MVCSNKWTKRLLIFFTDQTTGEVEIKERWTRTQLSEDEIDGREVYGIRQNLRKKVCIMFARCRKAPRNNNITPSNDEGGDISASTRWRSAPTAVIAAGRISRRSSFGDSALKRRSLSRTESSIQHGQKSVGELLAREKSLEDTTKIIDKLKHVSRDDFKQLLEIATKPETYPSFMDALEYDLLTRMTWARTYYRGMWRVPRLSRHHAIFVSLCPAVYTTSYTPP